MTSIVISSGHGKYVRVASGIIDEVDEARKVVEEVAKLLRAADVEVVTYHDDVSTTQNENLNRIVDFHNAQIRDLDISVHFNAFEQSDAPKGCEVWYVNSEAKNLAAKLSAAIARSGFIDRGAKYTGELFFLNHTVMPAVLLEICFVDSTADCDIYGSYFEEICSDIADILDGAEQSIEPAPPEAMFEAKGSCSYFGGPDDTGVDSDEGLALCQSIDDAPWLFLPFQPEGTTGLARRLNPYVHYVACRWDYSKTSKEALLKDVAWVRAIRTGIAMKAFPADWGPHEDTGRIADLSPGLMDDLGIDTDDEVEVTFPYHEA